MTPDTASTGRTLAPEVELRHTRDARRNIYRIEETGRGSFLAEYRDPDRQPFRVPKSAHDAAAKVLVRVRSPESFERLLALTRKEANEELPDYLLRTCLRFWMNTDPPLVKRARGRYAPVRRSSFTRDTRNLWADLVARAE